jgi:Tol biopolymer transport system component
MKKIYVLLMLVFLLSACITTTPVPPPLETQSNIPAPSPTALTLPNPALNTSGPYLAYLRNQGDQYEIMLTDADGKGQKLIPYPANANLQGGMPSLSNILSPDGQWLAYYTGSAGQCFGNVGADTADLTLNLMSLSDGKTQVITKLLSPDYPSIFAKAAQELNLSAEALQNAFVCGITQSIAWSPDGNTLAFAGQMDGLSSDLYIYDMISQTIKRLSSGPEEVQNIAWSPDSQWILSWSSYAVGEGMTYSLYATSLDGSVINTLPVSSCDTTKWLDNQTCFSSEDGNGVGLHNLRLLNIATGGIVTIWDGEFGSFAVSADHEWVALFSQYSMKYLQTGNDPDFVPGLYLVNLKSLEQRRVDVPDPSHVYEAIQSIDSVNYLFALIDATEKSLYYLSVDGRLVPTGIRAETLSVAPNQQYMLAVGDKFHIMKTDGTSVREINLPASVIGEFPVSIIWRPDLSGLFFINTSLHSPETPVLYAMDLLSGDPVQVDTMMPNWWISSFEWVGRSK